MVQGPLNKVRESVDSVKICAGTQASAGGEGFVLNHPYTRDCNSFWFLTLLARQPVGSSELMTFFHYVPFISQYGLLCLSSGQSPLEQRLLFYNWLMTYCFLPWVATVSGRWDPHVTLSRANICWSCTVLHCFSWEGASFCLSHIGRAMTGSTNDPIQVHAGETVRCFLRKLRQMFE